MVSPTPKPTVVHIQSIGWHITTPGRFMQIRQVESLPYLEDPRRKHLVWEETVDVCSDLMQIWDHKCPCPWSCFTRHSPYQHDCRQSYATELALAELHPPSAPPKCGLYSVLVACIVLSDDGGLLPLESTWGGSARATFPESR